MKTIDFSKVRVLTPVPNGWHAAHVKSAREGVSKAGNSKVTLVWELDDIEFSGRVVFDDIVLEGDGLWNTALVLAALGIVVETEVPDENGGSRKVYVDSRSGGPVEFEPADLIGLAADLRTELSTYEGKTNPKRVAIRAPRVGVSEVLA